MPVAKWASCFQIATQYGNDIDEIQNAGLTTFRTDYPEAQVVLLHRGSEPFVRDGIPCIPVERFLRALHPET